MAEKIEIITTLVDQVTGKVKKITKELQTFSSTCKRVVKTTEDLSKGTKTMTETISKSRTAFRRFRMEWLSLMFLGMALQRTFGGIAKTAITDFKRANESTQFWNTAIGRLQIGFALVRLAIGDVINRALSPLSDLMMENLGLILDLVSKYGDWILKLTLLGTILAVGGTLILGLEGLVAVLSGPAGLVALATALVGTGMVGMFKELTRYLEDQPAALESIREKLESIKPYFDDFLDTASEKWQELKKELDKFAESLGFEDSLDLLFSTMVWGIELGIVGVKRLFKRWEILLEVLDIVYHKLKAIVYLMTFQFKEAADEIKKTYNLMSKLKDIVRDYDDLSFEFYSLIRRGPESLADMKYNPELISSPLTYTPTFTNVVTVNTGPVHSSIDIRSIADIVTDELMKNIKKHNITVAP